MAMKKFIFLIPVILVSCVPWNIAPKCKIAAPENGSQFARGDTIQVYVNASDDDGEISEVRFYLDGVGIYSTISFPYNYMLETATLEIGTHQLKAEAIDNSGKDDNSEISFTITPALPKVRTLAPVLISFTELLVGGTIIDDGGGTISEAGIMWSYEPYDVEGSNKQVIEVVNNTFTVTLTDQDHRLRYLAAYAENENGRAMGDVVEIIFPSLPVCEILEPEDGSIFIRGDSIQVLVNATDDDGYIVGVRAYVDSKPVAYDDQFPYSFPYATAGLSIGNHTMKVEAEDNEGLRSEDAVTFTINASK